MNDVDVIEAINIDQLVTATDRLLVIGARNQHLRRTIDLTRAARTAVAASLARQASAEETVFVRQPTYRVDLFASAVLFAAAWFGVACACLLA